MHGVSQLLLYCLYVTYPAIVVVCGLSINTVLNSRHKKSERRKNGSRYGVPQRSFLEPLMFGLFVNDLPQGVKCSSINMYVDDTTLDKFSKN